MADSRNIVIELKVSGGSGLDEEKNTVPSEKDKTSSDKKIAILLANKIASEAFQIVSNVATYELNRSLTLSENYKAQIQFSNTMTAINKAVSFGSSLVSGATFGVTVGGAHGAVIGAAISGITWGVNEAINTYQRFDQAYLELSQMNLQSSYAMSRLGLTNNGRGTQN